MGCEHTIRAGSRKGRARVALWLLCACGLAVAVAGCGEGKQDASEPSGRYAVSIAKSTFPAKQAVSRPSTLRIAVHNASQKPLPNVAVSVDSLTYRAHKPRDLADPERPTWIIDTGPGRIARPPVPTAEVSPPGNGTTAFVHTWALGRLAPGATKLFRWKLTPVRAGTHTVHYAIAAGLYGKAEAVLARGGGRPTGSITVHVAGQPPIKHVNPSTGALVPGAPPVSAGPVGAVP